MVLNKLKIVLNRKNLILRTLIVSVLLSFVFSSVYIAKEADHVCRGENCRICENISQCERTQKQISHASVRTVSVFSVFVCICRIAVRTKEEKTEFTTALYGIKLNI